MALPDEDDVRVERRQLGDLIVGYETALGMLSKTDWKRAVVELFRAEAEARLAELDEM